MIVYTHVSHLYIVFLQCGTNLEGNIKGVPFKYRLQHNFEYVIQYNYARPRDFRGSQTLFSKTRNSYFFLLSSDVNSPRIVTNHPSLKPIQFYSNSARPNFNFLVTHFVSGIMRFLNWVDLPTKDKIFSIICQHLLIQHRALITRKLST